MQLVPAWSLHPLILLAGYTTLLLFNALKYSKDMSHKYLKHYSILKALKYYQLGSIILPRYGMSRVGRCYKFQRVMKIKYSHASLITKVILSLLGPRTIHVRYGEMCILMGKMDRRKQNNLSLLLPPLRLLKRRPKYQSPRKKNKMMIIELIYKAGKSWNRLCDVVID